MALGNSKHRSKQFTPPKLMLTSMMDMFTIILIFLLISFSENPEKHQLGANLELPDSNAQIEYQKTVEVILTKNELLLNDEVMAEVNNHQIKALMGDDLKSTAFFKRLRMLRETDSGDSDNKKSQAPHILFLCDKSYSFKAINSVIKTAGMAGYPNFQFAVLEGK